MRSIRYTVTAAAALLLAASVIAPTAGAASDRSERRHDADGCKGGGWQELVREDSSSFRNQGQCVSYAQSGGAFGDVDPGCAAVEADEGDDGWVLVAHMSNEGGMFDIDSDLDPFKSWGTFVDPPLAETADFQHSFSFTNDDIMFRTGDESVWAIADYAELRGLIDAGAGDFAPNLCFETSDGTTEGNVLMRKNPEDPWISMNGSHDDGIASERIVWGEANYSAGTHQALKNAHGGINVYVHP
jgi:hypothetical protein